MKKEYTVPKLEELSPIDPRVLRVRLANWAAEMNFAHGRISPDQKETWVALHELLEPMEKFLLDVVKDARDVEAQAVVEALRNMHAGLERTGVDERLLVHKALLRQLAELFERGGHR